MQAVKISSLKNWAKLYKLGCTVKWPWLVVLV